MSVAKVSVRIASSRAELAGHMAVRERVFVKEQGFFETSDRDIWDENALHAVAVDDDRGVVGAVRFYALDEAGLWKGDRLAVLADARPLRVGAHLVRFAVATAGDLGGHLMLATVQVGVASFFGRLGWTPVGAPRGYRGAPHQRMMIELGVPAEQDPSDSYGWAYDTLSTKRP